MRAVICTEMLFPGLSIGQKIDKIADHGFGAIEFWGWRDKSLPGLEARASAREVAVANFSGHRSGSPIALETHDVVLRDLRDASAAAKRLDCATLMLLSNELGEGGRVVDEFRDLTEREKRSNLVLLLGKALETVASEISLVIEPLNIRVDHPGNYLCDMETAAEIVESVASPHVRILCDFYHMGVMGNDLEELARTFAPLIGYVHVADFPGRHEPGTGRADWRRILGALEESGYAGDVGFEYAPAGDSDRSLEAVRSLMHI